MSAVLSHGRNAWRDFGKPRPYRTDRTCKDKHYYTDEIAARAGGAVSIAERKNTAQLWCYKCRKCPGWHLTSSNQGARWLITAADPAPSARPR